MDDYKAIYDFLRFHRYPTSSSKNQKHKLQRRCQEHFKIKGGILYYAGKNDGETNGGRCWRQIAHTVEEQERIIVACHSSLEGGHFGRDKTCEIIVSTFIGNHFGWM